MVLEVHEGNKFVRINDIDCDKQTSQKIKEVMACFPAFKVVDWNIEVYEPEDDCLMDAFDGARGTENTWIHQLDIILDEYSSCIIEIEILGYIRG